MNIFIWIYIIPTLLTTILLSKYVDYQGGSDYLETICPEYSDEYRGYFLAFCSMFPLINIAFAIILTFWYVLEIFTKIKNRISK